MRQLAVPAGRRAWATARPGRPATGVRRLLTSRKLRRAPVGVFLGAVIVIEVLPLVWLLVSSVRPAAEFTTEPMWSIPKSLDWNNYVYAWTTGAMGTYLRNSMIAVFPSLLFIAGLSITAAFALEVLHWRGRNGVMLIFLAGIMMPLQIILLPLFSVYVHVHLINNLLSLIITYTAFGLPLTIFMLAAFYKTVPASLIEAAVIDGANIYVAFWRITVPMMRNALVTVMLVQFFFIWNDLLLSLTFISNNNLRTVQTGLLSFTTGYGQAWGPTFAAVCMAMFPTLGVYLFLNQRVIKGIAAGSVKG
jgi:raffinose/stachyose/melibiose transport system permease protein